MTQVLNTLNKLEKSRFEAFRRSTLPGNAVSEYIAHLLLLQNEHLVARTKASSRLLGAGLGMGLPHLERAVLQQGSKTPQHAYQKSSKPGHIATKKVTRPLHDLVSPNNADSIVVVASSLAKVYAQRLVTAAKRVAIAEGKYVEGTPLQPHQLEQAHEARVQAGLDPGFFLQKPSRHGIVCGKVAAAALGRVDRHDLLRQAALQAQEEYDQYQANGKPTPVSQKEKQEEEEKQEGQSEPPASKPKNEPSPEERAVPMDVEKDVTADEQKSEETKSEVKKPAEKKPEEQKPEDQEPADKKTEASTSEEQNPEPVEVEPNVLDEFSDDDDEPSEVKPPEVAEVPQTPAVPTKLPEALPPAATVVLLAASVPAPTPKLTSAAPMSMEDALLNDLDSDDSDNDD
jgi:hypothetical protein